MPSGMSGMFIVFALAEHCCKYGRDAEDED